MLVQFTVENFLSFRDATTLSMRAVGGDQQHPCHLVEDALGKGRSVLRAAAMYGANGAGKSNLIHAVRFAQDLIVSGTRSGAPISIKPFRLDSARGQAGRFEFIFLHDGILYSYGFQVNAQRVTEEWLYGTPRVQEVLYFQRQASEAGETEVEFGPSLSGRATKQKQFLEFVARGTRPNQLFLTEAVDRNVEEIKPIYDWFAKTLVVISAESQHRDLEVAVHKDTAFTEFMEQFLRAAGTGIDSVTAEETPLDSDRHFPAMPAELRAMVEQEIGLLEEGKGLTFNGPSGERFIVRRGADGTAMFVRLRTHHRDATGASVEFSIEEESDGTQRLIHLLPALFGLREPRERVVILDELDRRLHPLLSRQFVLAALACGDQSRRNQLVFTTHDTNLLDLELLRRDEIWFVEKDQDGASHLQSLAEFKVRPDLRVEKGYLNGRFGAIPFFGDIEGLGWRSDQRTALVTA